MRRIFFSEVLYMELYFQNLAHFLRYYFQNIYNIEDKSEFKNYTFKYLQTNIHLKLPDILIDYLEKNKKRLIKIVSNIFTIEIITESNFFTKYLNLLLIGMITP